MGIAMLSSVRPCPTPLLDFALARDRVTADEVLYFGTHHSSLALGALQELILAGDVLQEALGVAALRQA